MSDCIKFIPGIVIFLSLILNQLSLAQEVEHNYLVGPNNTTCDSLPEAFSSREEAISLIENAVFRTNEKFTINRAQGIKGGWYYSCDNKTGYVIVHRDNYKLIFSNVPKSKWDAFISTPDFESFVDGNLRSYQMRFSQE